jgi:hypothetical protein
VRWSDVGGFSGNEMVLLQENGSHGHLERRDEEESVS